MLGLDAESRLSVLTHNQDADGTQHYRYQQTFRGVPVWGEQVIVSEDKAGNVKNLFGRSVSGLGAELPAGASADRPGPRLRARQERRLRQPRRAAAGLARERPSR